MLDVKQSSVKMSNSYHQSGKWTRSMVPWFHNSDTNIRHTQDVSAQLQQFLRLVILNKKLNKTINYYIAFGGEVGLGRYNLPKF